MTSEERVIDLFRMGRELARDLRHRALVSMAIFHDKLLRELSLPVDLSDFRKWCMTAQALERRGEPKAVSRAFSAVYQGKAGAQQARLQDMAGFLGSV